MNSDKILGMVGGGKKLKIELYDIKALREYAKSLKINVTKNNKYIKRDVLLNKIKKKFN
jgi:hypothetical protein|tara:strand:+ start:1042 stop:1218 length:177 start_codon:yes stop_codon:yes gene_type:complete